MSLSASSVAVASCDRSGLIETLGEAESIVEAGFGGSVRGDVRPNAPVQLRRQNEIAKVGQIARATLDVLSDPEDFLEKHQARAGATGRAGDEDRHRGTVVGGDRRPGVR